MSTSATKQIKEFDGLRGLLACWVVLAHVIFFGGFDWLMPSMQPGIPVDLFIILSGFMIFLLLERGEAYGAYITRRFFRLFPAFFLSFIACVLLSEYLPDWTPESFRRTFYVANNGALLPNLAAHLTMLHGAVPDQLLAESSLSYLPPAWSISLEWQFYLLAPLLFTFLKRPNLSGALLVALLIVLRQLTSDSAMVHRFLPRLSFGAVNAFLPLKLELFLIGGFSAFIWKRLSAEKSQLKLRADWLAVILGPIAFFITRSIPIAIWSAFFLLVIGSHFGQLTRLANTATFFTSLRPAQWLGRISYSIYIIHWPVLVLLTFALRKILPQLPPIPRTVFLAGLGFPMTFFIAEIMYRWVEKPCIDYARNLTTHNRMKTIVATGPLITEASKDQKTQR